jgi:site-specific DNA recombinase
LYNQAIGSETDRAAIYVRVSSPNQKYNFSIDGQIDLCMKLCEDRGWEIKYIYVDEAESAKNLNRTKFPIMLEKAKQGLFNVLVLWKLDRLFRSLADTVNTERKLQEYGVNLCSVTEYIDTTTPVGRFNFRSLASVAEFERELIGERARMGLYGLAKQHKWPNSYPPFGYNKDSTGKLIENSDEIKQLHQIFTRYLALKSMPQLAYELNNNQITTKKGNKWNANSVRHVLTNELYIGNYSVAGYEEHIEEYQILEERLFFKVQKIRLRHKTGKKRKPKMPKARRKQKANKLVKEFTDYLTNLSP